MNEASHNWSEANQRYLMAALAVTRATLERHAARVAGETNFSQSDESLLAARENLRQAAAAMPAPAALDTMSAIFALSPFERDSLLLGAGMELDSSFAALCAAAQGDARRAYPTFGLALAALPEAHWDALSPTSPLRRWRLIEATQSGDTLTNSQLRIDERALHYLTGVQYLDDRLRGLIEPVTTPRDLPPSQRARAERLVKFWSGQNLYAAKEISDWPIIFLGGNDYAGKRAVAAAACAALGTNLQAIRAADLPQSVAEREALARLWEREAALQGSALLLDQEEHESPHAVRSFIEGLRGMIVMIGHELSRERSVLRPVFRIDVDKPSAAEQRALWQESLGPLAPRLNGQLDPLIAQFDLSADRIQSASLQASEAGARGEDGLSGATLWDACRIQARPRLDDLAQRIEPVAEWDELVLPERQMRTLGDIAAHVRQRAKVYETWGFAAKERRGLGISALFAGASGTGKTMAAEVLAGGLRLDLYRIDLSQVVSKYIGETEKNLRRVFDAAEEGGAVLLFDEADALFGKRSEVKDSHDRYANIEVSYLLQRMEAYRGLAILTTNLKAALDPAFLRRLRFVVQFPFPDAAQRAEIWRRIFPRETPTENLEMAKLARLNITGGNIRNIAMQAAFFAADSDEAVTMSHLLRAARCEYDKMEKPLTETEIAEWV
ncbi:MAG TPA: ATP-binding protein [Pyrinomonadaceae bacterium]|nr:ATP-binding protein [Pyrinomonadaceae bacterium]